MNKQLEVMLDVQFNLVLLKHGFRESKFDSKENDFPGGIFKK